MPGIKRDFYDVCPDCWSVRIKHRVFKNPRYKCEKCGSEFMNKKRISHDDRLLFNDVMKMTSKKFEQRYGSPWDETYLRKAAVKSIKGAFNTLESFRCPISVGVESCVK